MKPSQKTQFDCEIQPNICLATPLFGLGLWQFSYINTFSDDSTSDWACLVKESCSLSTMLSSTIDWTNWDFSSGISVYSNEQYKIFTSKIYKNPTTFFNLIWALLKALGADVEDA